MACMCGAPLVRWDVLEHAHPEKVAIARALVPITARRGWTRASLREAARLVCGDAEAWRRHFPRGARDAVWCISEASDASMAAAFGERRADAVAAVIQERFEQNASLKPFVFRVMLFDFLRPVQAVRRMQRTAHAMRACLRDGARAPDTTPLNWAYTLVVFFWLFDRSPQDVATFRLNRRLMRVIGG